MINSFFCMIDDLFLIVCLSPHCSVNGLQCICLCDRDGVQIVEGINLLVVVLILSITYHALFVQLRKFPGCYNYPEYV